MQEKELFEEQKISEELYDLSRVLIMWLGFSTDA
jgi:hypothetical protein